MKSSLYAVNVVNSFIASLMSGKLNGELFILNKPEGYQSAEYIVINSLPIPNKILQSVTVNVNIHVEDLQPGKVNTLRLSALTAIILDAFATDYINGNYSLVLYDQSVERNEIVNESYSNIRIIVSVINE